MNIYSAFSLLLFKVFDKSTMNLFESSKSIGLANFIREFYNQIDGLAMGSLLAPVIANIFMGYNKTKWLNKYNLNKSRFYVRYVDVIVAPFSNAKDSLNFWNFLNKKQSNFKFTIKR